MKEVAILLLLAVMLNGCSSTAVESPSGSVWQAQMAGGVRTSSGFLFNTQFTVSSGGALTIVLSLIHIFFSPLRSSLFAVPASSI